MPPALAEGLDVPPAARPHFTELLRVRMLWLYALVFFGYDYLVWGASSWLPSYLQEQRGLSESLAALGALPAGLLSAASIVLAGRYADRIQGRPRPLIVPAMMIAAVGVLVIPHVGSNALFVVAFTVVAVCATPAYPGSFSMPLKELDPRFAGVGLGLILVGGMVAGVISPSLFGAVVSGPGWMAAWAMLAVGPVVATVAALLLPRTPEAFRAAVPPHLLIARTTVPATAERI
jgi:nitrate/nitrite transporter NarK